MRFFRRGPAEADPTGDFWAWWPTARDRIAEAIATTGFGERLVDEISRAVNGIDPRMAWQLAPGQTATHAFCISPEGNAELRQVAIRWLAAAPPADGTWEYHASKPAAPQLTALEIGGRRFDLAATRVVDAWDPVRRRVDVKLWHPAFAGAPDPVRMQAGFLFLDNLLGEDEVERWIGEIEFDAAAAEGREPAGLTAEIARRRAEPSGDETWVLGEGTTGGQPEIVLADAGLKRIDHPFADHHVTIAVLYGADRFPTDAEAAVLNAEEDDLVRRLGDVAILAGRTTVPGRRTLHFVAADPDAMRPSIDPWAAGMPDALSEGLPQRRLKINFEHDMDWAFQRDLGVR
jgi:hypothetical protein